jgi:hypothetical protein
MQTGWQQEMPSLAVDYGDDAMSEWLDIGPTVEEEDGWGVDEDEFTTSLDYSKFTPDQIRQACLPLNPNTAPPPRSLARGRAFSTL